MKKAIVIFICFVLIGCGNISSDYDSAIVPNLTDAVHTIKTNFNEVDDGVKIHRKSKATSFHIGDGYIVTCAHCVVFKQKPVRTHFGLIMIDVITTDYVYIRDGKAIKLIGIVDDIALLHDPTLLGTHKITWGDSNKLRVGDKLILVGNSGMQGINIKTGIVSMLRTPFPILNLPKRTAISTIVVTIPINQGDSGGLIFAIRKGKGYVIGMACANSALQGYNFGIKSEYIKICINEIKGGKK